MPCIFFFINSCPVEENCVILMIINDETGKWKGCNDVKGRNVKACQKNASDK